VSVNPVSAPFGCGGLRLDVTFPFVEKVLVEAFDSRFKTFRLTFAFMRRLFFPTFFFNSAVPASCPDRFPSLSSCPVFHFVANFSSTSHHPEQRQKGTCPPSPLGLYDAFLSGPQIFDDLEKPISVLMDSSN